jgi:hypothetical protein
MVWLWWLLLVQGMHDVGRRDCCVKYSSSSSSVLNRQKKPLDGGKGEWLLDFMFQLYVDGRMYEYVKEDKVRGAEEGTALLLYYKVFQNEGEISNDIYDNFLCIRYVYQLL